MFAGGKSKERSSSSTRKVTPPSPSYMSNEQFASYLADLRSNRVNRPGGARPQPSSVSRRESPGLPPSSTRSSFGAPPPPDTSSINHQRTNSDTLAASGTSASVSGRPSFSASVSSRYSTTTRGRDYYPDRPVQPLKPSEIVPSATYIERGHRWMEKEEAVSLRQAMEDMDLKDQPKQAKEGGGNVSETSEEVRLYNAALDEAAELVWRHQNPGKLPQPGAPYAYKPHLRKNSYAHARTASAGMYGHDVAPTGLARDPTSHSVSGSSSDEDGLGSMRGRSSFASSRQASGRGSFERPHNSVSEKRNQKSYGSITGNTSTCHQNRRSSLKRNISGEVQKPFSGDQIWEEADTRTSTTSDDSAPHASTVQPLRMRPKNPLNRVQFAPEVPSVADASPPPPPAKVVSKVEIYRNPPTQTRNPLYTTNQRSESPVDKETVPRKHGMEVRSEDIRQATSMRLKDRSPKLPTPSAVSDVLGRPIVSFDRNWKPSEEAAADKTPEESRFNRDANRSTPPVPIISISDDFPTSSSSATSASRRSQPPPPSIQINGPSIPTISVPDATPSIPTIVLPGEPDDDNDIPVIITPDNAPSTQSRRPLPTPQPGAPRVRHQAAHTRRHWSPASELVGVRATARCHECGHGVEGRYVSLSGTSERFHPQCFSCYTCGTSLEALEISPEPDTHRAARLDRIARRAAGEILPEAPGETMAEDGDGRLRLYCHLDWHEMYAPRCSHCKTPIMGEHVVALGSHWHFGHFFCAECGDPFERGMTHIEKDGYAWCVSCQTKRTERRAPKCRRCKKAVIGQYVQALGGEWHDECFRCNTCAGGFDDGQVFPRDRVGGQSVVLCTWCIEKELKA